MTDTEAPDELRDLWRSMDPEVAKMVQLALPPEYGSKSTADYTDEERALFFAMHAAVTRSVTHAQDKATATDDDPGLEPYPETLDPAPLYERIMLLRPEAQAILNSRWIERGLPAFDAPLPYEVYLAAEATVASVEPEDEDHPDTRMLSLELPPSQRYAFRFRCRNEIGNAGPMEMTTGRTWQMRRILSDVATAEAPEPEPETPKLTLVAPSAEDLKTIASAVAWVHGDALRASVLKLHEMRRSTPRARLLRQLDEIIAAEVDEPKVTPEVVAEVHEGIAVDLAEAQAEVDEGDAIDLLEMALVLLGESSTTLNVIQAEHRALLERWETAGQNYAKGLGRLRSAIRKLKGAS